MKYGIKIIYNTGDSFSTQKGLEEELDYNWSNYDIVEQNLLRIKEHYDWYRNDYRPEYPKPLWLKKEGKHSIPLLLDDGTEQLISIFWADMFSSMQSCEIVLLHSKYTW
jgi:hypothetical protein